MNIAVLGLGAWGFCLARHLALQGHNVIGWSRDEDLIASLTQGKDHPHLKHSIRGLSIRLTSDLHTALQNIDCCVESVTTSGLRPVLTEAQKQGFTTPNKKTILVLTSKGIERESNHTPPQIIEDIFGSEASLYTAMLSGPSFAQEVSNQLPTAIVCGAKNDVTAKTVSHIFSSNSFRVYPNKDIIGVSLGGALKNIIAIASGIADGLELGTGAKASLVTRGLHELKKLATILGALPETLYGLSGLGDLYLTCSSPLSRNFRFGKLLSEGMTQKQAEKYIGMVVEGASTAIAAQELSRIHGIEMPITEAICKVLSQKTDVKKAVQDLMQRIVKEEQL